MKSTSTDVSVDTLRKLFDLTPRRIQQLAVEGIVTRTSGGRYDLVRSVKGYIAYLRASPSSVEGSDGATLNR